MGRGDWPWLILGMMVATYLVRVLPFIVLSQREMPRLLRRFLRYVPVSTLTALIVLLVVAPQGTVSLRPDNAYLWGGLAGALAAWRTRRLLPTLAMGMVCFWAARALWG